MTVTAVEGVVLTWVGMERFVMIGHTVYQVTETGRSLARVKQSVAAATVELRAKGLLRMDYLARYEFGGSLVRASTLTLTPRGCRTYWFWKAQQEDTEGE